MSADAARPALRRRRMTTSGPRPPCLALPRSLDALDLPGGSALAALRAQVLARLDALEGRLVSCVSEDGGEPWVERARAGLQRLRAIRADVCAALPSYDAALAALPSYDAALAALPSYDSLPGYDSAVAGYDAALAALPDLHVRARLAAALDGLPDLHADVPSVLDRLLASELVRTLNAAPAAEDGVLERAAKDLTRAVKASMHGAQLIAYNDLPHAWKNNHFVTSGYRFIPLERWPLILLSLFMIHNETLNIHTHLIPLVHWLVRRAGAGADAPECAFLGFACLCLLSSAIWHTMSGCAHRRGMELCARVDYVGIGWLIAASVGTVVYYGFQTDVVARNVYLALCLLMGVTGSVFPFMAWFNMREYKLYRVAFFVFLAFVALAPLAHFARLHGARRTWRFIAPIVPSLGSYVLGLAFYVSHFPECVLPLGGGPWDALGGGSHAIWHVLIVRAIYQHKTGMRAMRGGFA